MENEALCPFRDLLTVPPPNQDTIETGEGAMRNNKFVKIVIWIVVLLVIAGLALPVFTSFFGF